MSENNETNQTAPEFKINECGDCPVLDLCSSIDECVRHGSPCEIANKIEALVNGKR